MTFTTPSTVLDREFLEIRARLLDLAAAFDRIDRDEHGSPGDERLDRIQQAVKLLQETRVSRAESMQLIFSRTYEETWRAAYEL